MADPFAPLTAFMQELRRRRVFRVAAFYGGIAFVIVQIIDGTFEVMGVPPWVSRLLIVLLAVGFPVAMGLAWVFDITSEGIVRTKGPKRQQPKEPRHPVIGNYALAIITAVAVAVAVWSWWSRPTQVIPDKSIAVLPFDNLSDSQEDEYFSDGITDEIIMHLQKIGDLKVISRTSIMQYKGTTKNIRQIGEELGVGVILEGQVQRIGNRVRIRSQLIDARTDANLWADAYEGNMTDVWGIQSEVARKIAAALEVELTEQEAARIEKAPTDNPDAYDFYLRGIDYGKRDESRFAIQMYERAVALDPTFALAHARLSRMHTALYWYHEDHTPARLALARAAVDQALALDPDLPEAHFALGHYYYQGQLEYDRALQEFAITLKGLPSHAETWAFIGYVYRRQGDIDKALAHQLKADELDPRSSGLAGELGGTYRLMRQYPEAERYATRAISLAPDRFLLYYWKVEVLLATAGDVSKARGVVDAALQVGATAPLENPGLIPFVRARLNFLEGDYRAALEQLAPAPALLLDDQMSYLSRAQMSARIYERMGQGAMARTAYDSARVMIEAQLQEDPADSRYHSALGLVYAGLGRRQEAVQAGRKGVELLPISQEALRGYARELDLAKIYVMVGEHDLALERIEYLLSIPGELSVSLLRLEPVWEPLREHPRFQALVAEYGGNL